MNIAAFHTERRRWFAAFAGVVLLAAGGFWRVEAVQHEACQGDNEFRRHDLPLAFNQFARNLGRELGAEPVEIERFIVTFDDDLERGLPAQDC